MGRSATYATTSSCVRLDVRELARRGSLVAGRVTTWRWSSGGASVASALLEAEPHTLRLLVGGRTDLVELEEEPLHYGGTRPWFRCPRCGRRCGVLYLRSSWACRKCQRLVYLSTRLQAGDRLAHKVERLLHRLGVPWGTDPRFARKPRGMWWRTYEELVRRAREAEVARTLAWCASSEAWFRRMESRLAPRGHRSG